MDKSPDAFRTISEVAETLETPAHVLRFWESRFPQIRPVKRAGGRRYYRPADVALLTGIKRLLHDEGLTIRGVQKILREQGVRHVAGLAGVSEADLAPFDPGLALEEAMAERFGTERAEPVTAVAVETAQIFALESALRRAGPIDKPETADLFDLLAPADPRPADEAMEAGEPAAEHQVDVAEVPRAPVAIAMADASDTNPMPPADTAHVSAALTVSRAAKLRALPRPLPDDLLLLRNRIVAHRDQLREAARSGAARG